MARRNLRRDGGGVAADTSRDEDDSTDQVGPKRLRREMTPPEVWLWLRLRRLDGGLPRFRRQHALGPYVLDFYCPAARLAVEVDGWGHNMGDQPEKDEVRDAWLAARGIEVVRILASEVLADPDEAAHNLVLQAVAAATPPPSRR